MAELLPPLKPIPIKERLSVLSIEKGHLDVLDGAFVIVTHDTSLAARAERILELREGALHPAVT